MTGPHHCPYCAHPRVEVQVVAWWSFDHGVPDGQGDPHIEPLLRHNAVAVCDECGEMWNTEVEG